MKQTIDYSKSQSPHFDAVEDVKTWFGSKWDEVSAQMSRIKDCDQFAAWANFAGVFGFPVKAWYELYHGEGSWFRE